MSKFGLWWVGWNGSDCESRMTVGGRKIHQNVPFNTLFPERAYYSGTNLEVIDTVRRKCPGW